jgi:serine/threonine-protein kinase ATR
VFLYCFYSLKKLTTGFHEKIEIMRSLARPRKITVLGSDGNEYVFLGKPKDDLRKDARLMDLNTIINNLLKTNSESRRRQLRTVTSFTLLNLVLIDL